ncbi:hypothetical protein RN001_013269 [Aquatica leii]|uniref:Ketimine reductase mu-crystallin n=1 Tax=Aquatica leii TaxID=1421715 RepID=A0AAN7NZW4_9COLE|nr:hypothetical protein RN001_013269 [Aquatica leii]
MTCPYEYISDDRVRELLTWAKTFDALECAMESVANGRAFQSPRGKVKIGDTLNFIFLMPAYLKDDKYGALTSQVFTKFHDNPKRSPPLPIHHSDIALIDDKTGVTKAIVAGNEAMEWVTASATTIATKYLHGHTCGKPNKILAVIGAGTQGRINAIGLQAYFNFDEVRIWNRTAKKAVDVANELNKRFNRNVFVAADTVENALKNADVIVTATPVEQTLVKWEWVKKGAHINAIGVNPFNTELDAATYRGCKVYGDYWDGIKTELKHIEAFGVKFEGQVGDVIAGNVPAPGSNDTTIFQSLGMAVEDCAVARWIYDLHKTLP